MDDARVYIIDNSLIFRAMLETIVTRRAGLDICGIAASAEQALAELDEILPDIILLDLNLRNGMSGLRFLSAIANHEHPMRVVIVSAEARRAAPVCQEAFDRGAIACFDKAQVIASEREFVDLLRDVSRHRPLSDQAFRHAVSLPLLEH